MKRPIILLLIVLFGAILSTDAAVLTSFDVGYTNNVNYSVSSVSERSGGLWLGNLRGNGTWRDMIVANTADDSVTVRLSNDNGTFGSETNFPVDLGPTCVRSIDVNLDGVEDIITANSGTNTISVLINLGNGTGFDTVTNYEVGAIASPQPVSISTADINADHFPDIVVANALEDSVTVLTNAGDGTFIAVTNCTVGTGPESVYLSDLNADGLLDIITANKTAGSVSILPQLEDGTFGALQTIDMVEEVGGVPLPVQALCARLNTNDTLPDLIVLNNNSNKVSILRNDGSFSFTPLTNYDVGASPSGMTLRDLNLDGYLDIAVANSNDATVIVLLGNGDCSFTTGGTFAVGNGPTSIASSKLDSWIVPDLAVANFNDNTVSILLYDRPAVETSTITVLEDGTRAFSLKTHVYPGRATNFTIVDAPLNGDLSGTEPDLTYTPDADYFGTDSFSFSINDGYYTSPIATNSVRVLPVNDRPSFTLSTNRIEATKIGMNVAISLISSSSKGPVNESSQTITYTIITNSAFFATLPKIQTNALIFKPNFDAIGTNTILIYAKDSGGNANGGTNTSTTNSIDIVVLPNPFLSVTGVFNGLFSLPGGPALDSAGYFSFTLRTNGTFSGKTILGGTYSCNGQFDVSGHANIQVSRGTNAPLTMDLNLDFATPSETVSGTVSDGVWTADLVGYRGSISAPQAGRYTMLFPGETDPSVASTGSGYGLVTVTSLGAIKLSGVLADKKTISQATSVSTNGMWPLYVSLYSGKGALTGWLTFTNDNNTSISGEVTWIKSVEAGGDLYPAGFSLTSDAIGSTYVAPAPGNRIISLTTGNVRLTDGNLAVNQTNSFALSVNNTITAPGATNKLMLTVSTNLGTISGTFRNPITGKSSMIKGVFFQEQNRAEGFIVGTNEGGAFFLSNP